MNSLGAALFTVAAVAQYNDPDPLPWMCVYGGAAAACVAGARRVRLLLSAAVGAVGFGWLFTTDLPTAAALLQMFDTWQMSAPGGEEAREASGLLIVGVWMAVIAFRSVPREDPDAPLYVRRRSTWSA